LPDVTEAQHGRDAVLVDDLEQLGVGGLLLDQRLEVGGGDVAFSLLELELHEGPKLEGRLALAERLALRGTDEGRQQKKQAPE